MIDVDVLILYVSDVCNLRCTYCLWPKEEKVMITKNKNIRQKIATGEYFKKIKENVDTSHIHTLDLWGGEPTLNFDVFIPALKEHLSMFPNLKRISFSTNISKDFIVSNIIWFIKEFTPSFNLDIQLSLDGPSFINDETRINSTSSEIANNIFRLNDFLKSYEHTKCIYVDIKSTLNAGSINKLSNEDNLYKYFDFFDKCIDRCNISFGMSYVFPGEYTQENGYQYAKIINLLLYKWYKKNIKFKNIKMPYEDQHVLHVRKTIEAIIRLKRRQYVGEFIATSVCSVGDKRIAIDVDGNLRICHGVFFYYDELKTDYSTYENYLKHNMIAFNKLDKLRLMHNSAGIHNNVEFRGTYHQVLATELALSGQISKIYLKEPALLKMLAFVVSRHHCISDNIVNTGDMMLMDTSYLKLLGNGAFELITKYLGSKYDI